MPTTTISIAKNKSRRWPSTALPNVEPTRAPRNTDPGEHGGTAPTHVAGSGVPDEGQERVSRDRQRAGPDGEVRLGHADHVQQKRRRQDRAAAADEAEREATPEPDRMAGSAFIGGDLRIRCLADDRSNQSGGQPGPIPTSSFYINTK